MNGAGVLTMKARSKAAKRARKRGRPRLSANGHDREDNGRLSRRAEGREARVMDVVLGQRIRRFGLTDVEAAKDPRRGYTLGVLCLRGRISEAQHDAGLRYAEDMARWFGLCVGSFPSIRAQNLFKVRGMAWESDGQADAALRARYDMLALQGALRSSSDLTTGRCIAHTVRCACLLDLPECLDWPQYRLQWLSKGLNALVGHYSL